MDAINKQTVIIELRRNTVVPYPEFIQNDTNVLEFIVKDNGANADLSGIDRINLNYRRPDGSVSSHLLSWTGNVVQFEFTSEVMAIPGYGELEVQFFDSEHRLTTSRFKVRILSSLGPYFEGGDGLPLLQELFIEVAAAVEEINETNVSFNDHEADRQTQEALRQTAEGQRSTAEAVRGNTESTRNTNEQNRQTAEIGRTNAEAARASAESTRATNEQTRQTQEATRQTNTQTAITNVNSKLAELQGVDVVQYNDRLISVEGKLTESDRQTQVLQAGVNVLNADVATPVDFEIQGRTLTSLGNSVMESSKYYVLADEKYKLKWADASITNGVGKFTGKAERPAVIRVANFDGKVSGSTVENPHATKFSNGVNSSLLVPSNSAFLEASQIRYGNLVVLDSTLWPHSPTLSNGNIAQMLFSFDLIAEVEWQIGKIPRSTTADKVQWLRANLAKVTCNWWGYGYSPTGNKATLAVYNAGWFSQLTHTNGSVTKISRDVTNISGITDSNGFVHFLAYAEPSDGTTASAISTDYVELEIELVPTADFTKPSIPLYEVDSSDYAKILVDWNAVAVKNRYPRVVGTQQLQNPYVIAEGENLLPPFTEWTLSSYARIINPYEINLTSSTVAEVCEVYVDVLAGTTLSLAMDRTSSTGDLGDARVQYYWVYTDGTQSSVLNVIVNNPEDVRVVPANVKKLRIRVANIKAGTFTFKNPMLTLGLTSKPFVTRNPSHLYTETKLGRIGTSADALYRQDGTWKRRKVIEKDYVLNGDLTWISGDYTGFKYFQITLPQSIVLYGELQATKYDGKLLTTLKFGSPTSGDIAWSGSSNALRLSASDTDTGFGETYTPSASEIKAYFYGWRMNNGTFGTPYDGTGTKTWVPIGDTSNARAVLTVPPAAAPTIAEGIIDHYKLSYVRSTPVIETVDVQGDIIADGSTQVEVGSGVIVREKATPVVSQGFAFINAQNTSAYLSKKPSSVLRIDRGINEDDRWVIWGKGTSGTQNGDSWLRIAETDFDPTADYYVTYIALDKHLLTNIPTDVTARYAKNIRSAHDDLAGRVSDNVTAVSIIVQSVAELYKRVKALGG